MFSFENLELRYEPYPIGIAKPLMEPDIYNDLVANYPDRELFAYLPEVGHKYSLSEKNNPEKFRDFIGAHANWRSFHEWVKSRAFLKDVLEALRERSIDLGYRKLPTGKSRLGKFARNLLRGKLDAGRAPLAARFEYSMLPAAGGSVIPHTDSPGKIITIVVSMLKEGEWNVAFGGGTDVNRPRDTRLAFNEFNRQGAFEEMEILDTYEFTPNQGVLFIKTFNSWHSVRPMTGNGSDAMRRTLTINIEEDL